MFPLESGDNPLRGPSIDDLALLQESGMVKQIEQDTFKRQCLYIKQ
jgi:hypothetical protein